MAMNASGLSAAIKAALDGKFPLATGTNAGDAPSHRQDFADTVAQAIITYILASNVVVHPMGPGKVT